LFVVVRPGLPESIRNFVVDANAGALTRALKSRPLFADSSSEIDREIHGGIRCPGASERCVIVPLVLKEKVGVLLYRDAGNEKRAPGWRGIVGPDHGRMAGSRVGPETSCKGSDA
jgi:hypothetical protein